jgi:hypothetical protein
MRLEMKNIYDNIGNRTGDLPAYSTVPQPSAPPSAPRRTVNMDKIASCLNVYFVYEGKSTQQPTVPLYHIMAESSIAINIY